MEQTINADAARKLTGIIHLTDSISACQRWARSHDIRSTVITHVMEEVGLGTTQDISAELQPSSIKKSPEQLTTFIKTFDQYINPFSHDLPMDQLFNIASGKGATPQVEKFLLSIEEIGNDQRETFITECSLDINTFERTIKKTPIHNFSSEIKKKKKVKIGGKDQKIQIQRDLFGRMLGISMNHKLDVLRILSYPITPVPLALCHLDGVIYKTAKSALAKCLEAKIDHNPLRYSDVYLIDGFFILHAMKEVPKRFGNISKRFLQMITKYPANRMDVIFDQYWLPSIKDSERQLRKEAPLINYSITGPDQTRPTDFAKELKNTNFKESLIHFFFHTLDK
ncbi:uncharacterized protein LOC118749071 [Rhagoletis pomonella]|uniref:uncharacterized protein LOC118749071 n=1 Tax=Rhagoletis pomonella TaxID=28610 RepID=UPI001782008B|nr:uncharacterized protein LOC118749071 [Rhagoletis pomonella]